MSMNRPSEMSSRFSGLLGFGYLCVCTYSRVSLPLTQNNRGSMLTSTRSPVYLVNNGRLTKARKVMATIHGSDNSINARLAHLVKTIREEQAQREVQRGTYFECFKGKDLRRTLTAIFLYTANNW